MLAFAWLPLLQAACVDFMLEGPRRNLQEKLENVDGRGSGGADFYPGSKAASMYIYVESTKTEEEEGNDFGCKVAIHEYQHILQQGFLSKSITSLTPPTDTLGEDRFIIQNFAPNLIPAVFAGKVLGCMNAMPATQKLLTIPTHIMLIPSAYDDSTLKMTASQVASGVEKMLELQFQVSKGCPCTLLPGGYMKNENNAMAEGEAEYYSESADGYVLAGVKDWTVPFDAVADWNQRIRDGARMVSDKKADFRIGDGSGETMGKLEDEKGIRGNPAGEQTWNYLKTSWRTQTTHAEMQTIWMRASDKGYGAAFEEVMGSTWSSFVCDMQIALGVDVTCVEQASWNLVYTPFPARDPDDPLRIKTCVLPWEENNTPTPPSPPTPTSHSESSAFASAPALTWSLIAATYFAPVISH